MGSFGRKESRFLPGGVHGDVVFGLPGGVLSLADQDRSVARREPG